MSGEVSETESEIVLMVQNFVSREEKSPGYLLKHLNKPKRVKRFLKKSSQREQASVLSEALGMVYFPIKSLNIIYDSNIQDDKSELESFTLLLENGIHPNCLYYGYHERVSKKGENQSILRKAINENKADFVRALLENGADSNFIDGELGLSGYWPRKAVITNSNVHRAVECENSEIVKMLVDKNADLTIKSKVNTGPLHTAIKIGKSDIVKTLLSSSHHADEIINSPDRLDMSPLELAIESFSCPSKASKKSPELFRNHLSNYGSIIKDLAEKGAEVNVICKSGESCMIEFLQKIEKLKIEEFLPDLDDFFKIRELMMSVCSALVSRGCDLTRSSKTEDTALNYFAFFGFCELIEECPEILFEKCNKQGWNCLHFAAQTGQFNAIKLILKKHKSLKNRKNNDGQTPFDVAEDQSHPRCADLLLPSEKKCVKFNPESSENGDCLPDVLSMTASQRHKLPVSELEMLLYQKLREQTAEINELKSQISVNEEKINNFLEKFSIV